MAETRNEEHLGKILLDAYYVDRTLDTGAFSTVYHARTRAGVEVAIKVLYNMTTFIRFCFSREVKVLKALTGTSNVIQYIDDGTLDDGTPALVTEFVDGVTLGTILSSAAHLTQETSVRFAIELCQAIEPLHVLGLVHRDIKPNNIMLRRDGHIKLIDFGLVRDAQGIFKLLEKEEPQRLRAFAREIDTGVLAGTYPYMAPEQFSDAMLDDMNEARTDTYTDVFSIGVILYELLSLQRPFDVPTKGDFNTIMDQRLQLGNAQIPPLRGVDDALSSIVLKALDEDTNLRHTSARELREELLGYLQTGTGATIIHERPTLRFPKPTKFEETQVTDTASLRSKQKKQQTPKKKGLNGAVLLLEAAGERIESGITGSDDSEIEQDTPLISDEVTTIPNKRGQRPSHSGNLTDRPLLVSDEEYPTDKWRPGDS